MQFFHDTVEFVLPVARYLPWAILFIVFLAIRKTVIAIANSRNRRDESLLRKIIISACKKPSVLWCLYATVYFAFLFNDGKANYIAIGKKIVLLLLFYSITRAGCRIVAAYSKQPEPEKSEGDMFRPVFLLVIEAAMIIFSSCMVLEIVGLQASAVLIGLSVFAVVVVCAMHDEVANFFAGVYIKRAKPFIPGQYL
ncbi:hypothetical protein JXJ21_25280 [candidate division KSB1 bacterium]|nr:hypothetical protein [candidate division KSB1 bacterium]